MTVNEDQRFRMHLELRRVFGDEVGNTVMEHLPPRGWGDVARTVDVTHVSERLIQAEHNLTLRIDQVEAHLTTRIDHLDATVNARIDQVEAHLTTRIDQVEATVNTRIDNLETRLQGITSTLRVMIGSTISVSAAIIVMLVQINQSL